MATNSKEYNKANYYKYWGNAKAIKDRAARNQARRLKIKEGVVKKGDGKEVDHKNGIRGGNGKKNLRILSRIKNRRLGQIKAMKNRVSNYNLK